MYKIIEDTQADFQEGTLTNVVATAAGDLELEAPLGKALNFDGNDDYVKATVSGISFPFDVEFHIKVDSIPSDSRIIFVHAETGAGCGFYQGDSFILKSGNSSDTDRRCDLSNFKPGEWNLVKISYDVSGQPSVLINGEEPNYLSDNYWTETTTNDLLIGRRSTGYYCQMVLADFRFVKNGTDYLLYEFDEGEGTTAYDSAGNNDGTIYGATWVDTPYAESGTRISPILDLSPVGTAASSSISWNATVPADTSLTIETNLSLDGGETWQGWQAVTNGGAIPGITEGTDLSNARLQVRQTLSTTDTTVTPQLHSLTVEIAQIFERAVVTHVVPIIIAPTRAASKPRSTKVYVSGIETGALRVAAVTRTPKAWSKPIEFKPEPYKWGIWWVPLGVFWSGDWSAPEDGVYAQTTGRDRLELLRKSTYSTSTVQVNTTLYDLAVAVLQDAGLKSEEYWVDTELQQYTIPYAYFEPMSHREALRLIAEACLGQVYCDREGIIRVEGPSFLEAQTESILTLTQDDYFRKDNPVKWSEIANYIEVETQPLRPVDTAQEVYRSNEPVTVPSGAQVSLTVYYNEVPCIEAAASLEGATNTTISSATYYAWGADLTLSNSGASDESVTVVINAKPFEVLNKEKAIAQDEQSITDNGLIRYTFPANPLVQTLSMAQTIADKLLASFKNPRRDVEMEWRGNPALLLADRITVVDKNEQNDYFVTRQELEFAGALRVRLSGRRTS